MRNYHLQYLRNRTPELNSAVSVASVYDVMTYVISVPIFDTVIEQSDISRQLPVILNLIHAIEAEGRRFRIFMTNLYCQCRVSTPYAGYCLQYEFHKIHLLTVDSNTQNMLLYYCVIRCILHPEPSPLLQCTC